MLPKGYRIFNVDFSSIVIRLQARNRFICFSRFTFHHLYAFCGLNAVVATVSPALGHSFLKITETRNGYSYSSNKEKMLHEGKGRR